MHPRRIVVAGGGFAGIKAALELSEDPKFRVTLVSDSTSFRYYPSLYRSATGGSPLQSVIPLHRIFEGKNVTLVHDTVIKLNRDKKVLTTASRQNIAYDKLILALGVTTNYFGIKGLKEYSFGIKSIEEAQEFKAHLHAQLTDEGKPDLNYIVIGGGPTGVELAGALPEYLKKIMKWHGIENRTVSIKLIEAAPRLIPRMPKDMSRLVARRLRKIGVKIRLNSKVEGETANSLVVDGKPIESRTVIWTAGVTNNSFFKDNDFDLSKNGKVIVNRFLEAEPDVHVIGDNADTLYSGTAQTALYDALFVTRNLKMKHPNIYVPKKPIYVIPAGKRWAAVYLGGIRLYGWFGWILRRFADLIAFHDLEPWWPATEQWFTEGIETENCPICAVTSTK